VPKLACPRLAAQVTGWLEAWWSPQEISRRLRIEFAGDPMMQVSHETIYQALFVQGRGELRRELARCLRTGRAKRRSRQRPENTGRIKDMVMISERPAEAADRAVPGHWEGDRVIGKGGKSAVGTLAERTTRSVMLPRRPGGHGTQAVSDAMAAAVTALPAALARSVTWDQGPGKAPARRLCPRHRGPGLLRRAPLTRAARIRREHQRAAPPVHAQRHRPVPPRRQSPCRHRRQPARMTLCWMTPSEKLAELIALTA
jgi:hypothetical protein